MLLPLVTVWRMEGKNQVEVEARLEKKRTARHSISGNVDLKDDAFHSLSLSLVYSWLERWFISDRRSTSLSHHEESLLWWWRSQKRQQELGKKMSKSRLRSGCTWHPMIGTLNLYPVSLLESELFFLSLCPSLTFLSFSSQEVNERGWPALFILFLFSDFSDKRKWRTSCSWCAQSRYKHVLHANLFLNWTWVKFCCFLQFYTLFLQNLKPCVFLFHGK